MTMIAHYPFNGNTKDRLGKYPGTPSGSVTWVDAKQTQGLKCNGSNAFVDIDAAAQYLHGKPEASIALWVKKDAVQHGLLQLSGYANNNGNLYPYQQNDKVYLDIFRTNRLGPIYLPKSTLEWHHLIITQKPGQWRLYQDGVLVHEAGANDTVSTDYLNGEIGRNSGNRYANGRFDDVRLYDHALSATEAYDVAKGRNVYLPLVGKSHDIDDTSEVLVDNVVYERDDILNREVAVFNGSSYIRLEQPFGQRGTDQVWSVEALIYRTDLSGQQFLVEGMNRGVKISHVDVNRRPLMYLNDGSNDHYEYGRSGSMPAGQWLHVVFVFDNETNYKAIYVNGASVGTGGSSGTATPYGLRSTYIDIGVGFKGKMALFRCYSTALSSSDVRDQYLKRLSFEPNGSLKSNRSKVVELGHPKKPIVDYSVWKDDGSKGALSGFGNNGAASKNSRVTDVGPFGEQAVLWQANNTDTASTADGGWNSPQFPIDNTKTYRFALWMRRKVSGNGTGYWGTHGYGSRNGLLQLPNGTTPNGNPYFFSSGISVEWRLYVGFIHPHDYDGGSHPDSGVYDTDGNKIASTINWKWLPESVTANHRAYLYYSTDVTTIQQFAYPRIDVCDGSEPSLDALLGGVDLIWSQNGFPKPFDVQKYLNAFGRLSELGVTHGLLHLYRFTKDYRDSVTTRSGTPASVTLGKDGVVFSGTGEVDLGPLKAFGNEWTVMCRYRPTSFSQYTHLLSAHVQSDFAFKVELDTFAKRPYFYSAGAGGSLMFNSSLDAGKTYHLAISYKDGVLKQYLNGALDNSHSVELLPIPVLSYRVGRWNAENSIGVERDLRIYDRELEIVEIAQQAKWSSDDVSTQKTGQGLLLAGELSEID